MGVEQEILAPAGTLRKLKVAFAFGADAVYCGISNFSLRARVNTFTEDGLMEGINYAHNLNKKVYVTVNIYPHEKDFSFIRKHLRFLKKAKPDAVIVSDPGVFDVIRESHENFPVHLSTQANVINSRSAKFWERQGVKRIILARELSLEEIRAVRKACPNLELEVFVHGDLCVSLSGRCLISNYLKGRDANKGACVQPCRWEYELVDVNSSFPISEDRHGSYILSPKTLCLIDHLEDLKKAGVGSFKIEGRTKSEYYVGLVSKIYKRCATARAITRDSREDLEKLSNRGYTTGFLFGEDENGMRYSGKANRNIYFRGIAISHKSGKTVFEVHNDLRVGDRVEIITPDYREKITLNELRDENGNRRESLHGGSKGDKLVLDGKYPIYALMREV